MPILALLLAGCLPADEPSALHLFQQGQKAEKAGHNAQAYLLYAEAAALDPNNQTYWLRSQALRSRALLETKLLPAGSPGAEPLPEPTWETATAQDKADVKRLLPPPELKASQSTHDFDLNEDAKKLYEDVAKAFGLDCVFDSDYLPRPPFRFRVAGADFREALHGVELATGTFIVPLSPKLFLVVQDTQQKRAQNEPTVTVGIPLRETLNQQEFNSLVQAVQQTMGIQRVSFDTQTNTVILRDQYSKVLPAQALINDLLHPPSQVLIEMELVEVTRNDMITYGIDIPTLFSLTPLTTILNNKISVSSSVTQLLSFGGGKTLIGMGVISASAVAQMSQGSGHVLLNTQLRAGNSQAATLHLGDRYPVMNSGYYATTGTSQVGSSTSGYGMIPSISYEDLGLALKVTPAVHNTDEVSLDVDAAFKLLTGTAVNGIPVVSNRSVKCTVRLRTGQWALVAGLLDADEARTVAGLAGVSNIPYLGPLMSTHKHTGSRDEVLILMRPHLLTPASSEFATRTMRVGSETRPITPL